VRRAVLDVALPFPVEVDGSFRDHWLGLCALALSSPSSSRHDEWSFAPK
jgi:hypothetical protein